MSSPSKILNLVPIFKEKLIKVGGRLLSVEIPVKNKHQIVVSKTHPIATGRECTLSILREKY